MVVKSRAPRFYLWRNGEIIPCYEVNKKSGNGVKPYTLKEARIDKALVSVTSVLSVIDKPDLDNWRVSQAIHSALTLPREVEDFRDWRERLDRMGKVSPYEAAYHNPPRFLDSEDAFAERVLADAEAQANKAAEFGTRIHDAIADHLTADMKGRVHETMDLSLSPYLESFYEWANENIEEVHAVEKCVGHPSIGVAGRMDLDCTLKGVGRCIADFKTQNIRNGRPAFYDDWGIQLAAYCECCFGGLQRVAVSVIIPSNEPGSVQVKCWDDLWKYSEAFHHAFGLWRLKNDYDPRH